MVPTPENEAGRFLAEFLFVENPEPQTKSPELEAQSPELATESPNLEEGSGLEVNNPELNETIWLQLMQIGEPIRSQHRPKKEEMEDAILQLLSLASGQFIRLSQLATLLGKNADTLRKNHLSRLLKEKKIELAFPTSRNHPTQGYTLKRDG